MKLFSKDKKQEAKDTNSSGKNNDWNETIKRDSEKLNKDVMKLNYI